MQNILSYYQTHSPITDPGPYVHLYDDLPDGVSDLVEIVQGLLLHKLAAENFGVILTRESRSDQHLRTMQQRLERMIDLDPSSLTRPREPKERQIGLCRDFALFLTSLMRHKGISARMRVGFAEYLKPDSVFKIDHWITEYWHSNQERWVLVDPDVVRFDLHLNDDFYLAGSAWALARSGKLRPDIFRYSGRWKGFSCIRSNLLHDFQAINKLELGPYDYWDELHTKAHTALTIEEKSLLDQIANLSADPDHNFDAIQNLFNHLPRTKRIYAKLQQLGILGEGSIVNAEGLKPSGADRLVELSVTERSQIHQKILGLNPRFTDPGDDDLPPNHPVFSQHAILPLGLDDIFVRGARQHNLKGINVRIPRHKLVVITGVSGSGKSSLAFDTIYAEGQRRYVESLSSFARQFMDQMEKPKVDQITGLSPAIAIEQKTISRNPRSTVGTVTEILDYLRVLYARIGTPHCPHCGRAVIPQSAQQITNQLAQLQPGTRFQILAPISRNRKGTFKSRLTQALRDGYTRVRIDNEIIDLLEGIPEVDKNKKHDIELITDRLVIPIPSQESIHPNGVDQELDDDFRTLLMDSVETTLKAGNGNLIVELGAEEIILSEHNACPECDISFPNLEPHLFSFNSPLGMCDECNGLGIKLQVDPNLIIDKPDLSLMDGACRWYGNLRKSTSHWRARNLETIAEYYQADLEKPWHQLPEVFKKALLYGSNGVKFKFMHSSEGKEGDTWSYESHREIQGIIFHINRLFRQTKSEYTRRHYMSFMSKLPCPKCEGERLNPESRFVTIDEKRLPELTAWSIESVFSWICSIPDKLRPEQLEIGGELIKEIRERIGFLRNVGLHYLTLDRPAPTLSGGEGQRIRLASQIGSGLVGVMYILDEPSIGLHARDHRSLLDTLIQLRDLGNTVIVVEHDEATMKTADWIIDLGPGPGIMGGKLVAAGSPEEIQSNPDSLTGKYLSGILHVSPPNGRSRRSPKGWMKVEGARLHNLKSIEVNFPLGTLIIVTGVSGSGKSSLIGQTLYPALSRLLHNAQIATPGPHDGIQGLELVDKVINITQDPIGRNPRSNPGTYVGVLTEIRKVFSETPQAKALGYIAGRFSFNVKGGRCEECKGYGYKKVEMHFLADVWVKCRSCDGTRFNHQTLAVTYKNKHIADILDMDVQEALSFFENHPKIKRILQTLQDVGLDYIKLGQSALTLSGGEAQRVKLAKELSRSATGKTVFFLDEPTTGLHFADIQRLLEVLHQLVDQGNTVIVIEHNLDVIRTADWIIDLGPEGGEKGGHIVAEGTPETVAQVEDCYTGHFLKEKLIKMV
ncbi:MAG: excinuclease ABC subunit UvrA [Anaerolineales bacterium]|nr:excinuclease ABC subunit UvrA [Anaerolineales bacterium]